MHNKNRCRMICKEHLLSDFAGPPMSPISGGCSSDTPSAEKLIDPGKEEHVEKSGTKITNLTEY